MGWLRLFLLVCTVLVAVALLGAWALNGFDTFDMSLHGVIAMILGAVLTGAVAIGLMALVFLSHRTGHDDDIGRPDPPEGHG